MKSLDINSANPNLSVDEYQRVTIEFTGGNHSNRMARGAAGYKVTVPYSSLSQRLQAIHRSGGKIIKISIPRLQLNPLTADSIAEVEVAPCSLSTPAIAIEEQTEKTEQTIEALDIPMGFLTEEPSEIPLELSSESDEESNEKIMLLEEVPEEAAVELEELTEPIFQQSPEELTEPISQQSPEPIGEDNLEVIAIEAVTPEVIAETVSETIFESIPDVVPERLPESIADVVPEAISESIPEVISESIPEVISESNLEIKAEIISEEAISIAKNEDSPANSPVNLDVKPKKSRASSKTSNGFNKQEPIAQAKPKKSRASSKTGRGFSKQGAITQGIDAEEIAEIAIASASINISEPAVEAIIEPIAEPVVEPIADIESIAEIAEPIAEPVLESIAEIVELIEPIVEPVVEPMAEAIVAEQAPHQLAEASIEILAEGLLENVLKTAIETVIETTTETNIENDAKETVTVSEVESVKPLEAAPLPKPKKSKTSSKAGGGFNKPKSNTQVPRSQKPKG
ncbi:phycobilisome linker polypeptide [Pseudanabaena sp. 'Roaring Creek']|uniref:phycobilisome linker polypeptide n=1 Tax=Pseudanabaena sp. 'Roaring Creek' TaxID=1681830 RepID=UPI0006D822BA|nr:phycobilisome linker polypeptide [Pseudanabaena sp. 'Roaring Creek']